GGAFVQRRPQRRPHLVPARVPEARADRPRHRRRRVRMRRPVAARAAAARGRRRSHVRGERPPRHRRRRAYRARPRRRRRPGDARPVAHRRRAAASRRPRDRARPSPADRDARAARARRRARQQHARRRTGQGRLRGRSNVPAGAGVEPEPVRPRIRGAPVRPRVAGRARRPARMVRGARPHGANGSGAASARTSRGDALDENLGGRGGRGRGRQDPMSERKPRTLFVSRERFRLPLDDAQRRKWDAVGEALDYRVVAAAATRSPAVAERFELAAPKPLLDGPLYYLALPFRVARALRTFRPDAVVVQNAHETALALVARAAVRSRTPVILDLHGDWRAATRLYGSPLRRLLQPIGDIAAQLAVRRADAVRTISAWTSGLVRELGVEPAAVFPAFVDAASFRASPPRPLPAEPRALYVGVLERYKGFDVLADAWPEVARALPDARLHVVGRGSLGASAAALVGAGGVAWDEALAPGEVAAA